VQVFPTNVLLVEEPREIPSWELAEQVFALSELLLLTDHRDIP
jgi:hypothetical protein